jgi:MinD-like ATPase involved in chromosome partitioning or flagellar assembly
MTNVTREGHIITFYSYKGGTGRSMAVANVACYLAQRYKVLTIDWDLDAPGLTQYFRKIVTGEEKKGILDFFEAVLAGGRSLSSSRIDYAELIAKNRLVDCFHETSIPNLTFMGPGATDEQYTKRLAEFDWNGLHNRLPGLFSAFAIYLSERFDYVLIDSRSGFSDIAGICTAILPEKLVAVFTPNIQSLNGIRNVARKATSYRRESDDIRPLMVFPLPSRIDVTEPRLLEEWRYSKLDFGEGVTGFQPMFENLFKETYALDSCSLLDYFDEIQIQHVPRYSYGEEIAFLVEERRERLSLSRSYEEFSRILENFNTPWDFRASSVRAKSPVEAPLEIVDEAWFNKQEERASFGLRSMEFQTYSECRTSLLRNRLNVDQARLLEAARQSQIRSFGWPIGVILDNRKDTRPYPTNDGVTAEIKLPEGSVAKIYDYWAWRRNGDFFMLQSLFEDDERRNRDRHIFFDSRIVRLTETLIYCASVYEKLGVPDDTPMQFVARWNGLEGRTLGAADALRFLEQRTTKENDVVSKLNFRLGRIYSDLEGLVEEILSPLFLVFDFFKPPGNVYADLINRFLLQVSRERGSVEGSRVDIDNLVLEVEPFAQKWIAFIYEKPDFAKLSQTEYQDEQLAKLGALKFALAHLGKLQKGLNDSELLARYAWTKYRTFKLRT